MNKLKINILFGGIAILFFSACEDFTSTTLKVDPPEHTEQLVLHSYISDQDSFLLCSVIKSVALLEDVDTSQFINGCTVEVFRDGQLLQTLEPITDLFLYPYNYGIELDNKIGGIGLDYEVRVTHPDFDMASSRGTMPSPVPVKSLTFEPDAAVDDFGDRVNGIEIIIDDPADEENFYEFYVYRRFDDNGNVFFDPLYIWSTDQSLVDGIDFNTYLLTDEAFNGKEYRFEVFGNDINPVSSYLAWKSITEEQYLYSRSVSDQRDALDFGAFSDPVSIFSNVDNGLGIFGLRSELVYKVD